eukprot:SAG25_NODE_288_length_10343_cov_3.673858_14_plen_93_part_00
MPMLAASNLRYGCTDPVPDLSEARIPVQIRKQAVCALLLLLWLRWPLASRVDAGLSATTRSEAVAQEAAGAAGDLAAQRRVSSAVWVVWPSM